MARSNTLTARQQEILALIKTTISKTGAPPTRAEIATLLGFASANAAEEHLRALARKGAIDLLPGTSRGIRVKKRASKSAEPSSSAASSTLSLAGVAQLCLPLIGRVAAGSPILAQEHVENNYYVQTSLFSQQPDYLLKVRGMSMRDIGIMDGDLLAIKSTREARNGQIVVARIGEEVTVKRFKQVNGLIELHPENPDFKVIVVGPEEPFAIEGLALGLIRSSIFA